MSTTVHDQDVIRAGELATASVTLARRFAAGATLWCVSPEWPSHGRHVAVEFVHPVIVGKRALPAVHLEAADVVGAVRLLARPGDVLLMVGSADLPPATSLLRRAETWGLTRLWLGAGQRPPADLADHIVWVEGDDPALAARSGEVVLLYHLLWELTHVVFEHPGLLAEEPPCTEEVCITCSDQGRAAEVREVHPSGLAEVMVAGSTEVVDLSLVDAVVPGDLVLVHAGVALTALPSDDPELAAPPTSQPVGR
jgi:hydrogenase maturation factor